MSFVVKIFPKDRSNPTRSAGLSLFRERRVMSALLEVFWEQSWEVIKKDGVCVCVFTREWKGVWRDGVLRIWQSGLGKSMQLSHRTRTHSSD